MIPFLFFGGAASKIRCIRAIACGRSPIGRLYIRAAEKQKRDGSGSAQLYKQATPTGLPAGRAVHFKPKIQSERTLVSAALICGNGGIIIGPHLPEPPFWICCSILPKASGSFLYLAAISR